MAWQAMLGGPHALACWRLEHRLLLVRFWPAGQLDRWRQAGLESFERAGHTSRPPPWIGCCCCEVPCGLVQASKKPTMQKRPPPPTHTHTHIHRVASTRPPTACIAPRSEVVGFRAPYFKTNEVLGTVLRDLGLQ